MSGAFMDKIIGFIRNNASLTVVVSLCIIPLILMFVQKQTPNAKNLSVTATVLSAEPRLAGFNLVVTNNDTVPFTYYMASTGTGMPSHNFKATVTTGDTVRTSLNRAWDPLPLKIPADQIFIVNEANDKLGSGTDLKLAPGATANTVVYLQNIPTGTSTVTFTAASGAPSAPLTVVVP